MLQASTYARTFIADWEISSCAGTNTLAYEACVHQKTALKPYDVGWLGKIAATPQQLGPLALTSAAQLWQRQDPDSIPNLPICCISSSKGSIEQAVQGHLPLTQAWPSAIAGLVCQKLQIPTYIGHSCAAACSTGLYTLLDAADYLEAGQSSLALCGAADASLDPLLLAGYKNLGVLAQAAPEAFTGRGTGFAPAEGAAFFILKNRGPWQLRAGVRAGDASHITRCEDADLIQSCLQALWDVLPHPDLIVTHATGTASGDAFEEQALRSGPWSSSALLHCKPVIGHCLGASGCVELAIGLHSKAQRIWKLSLGFGGHIAAVALERKQTDA